MKLGDVGFELKCRSLTLKETEGKAERMGVTTNKLLFGKEFKHLGRARAKVFSLLDDVILQWDSLCHF